MIQTGIRHWRNLYCAEVSLAADLRLQWDASLAHIDVDDLLADAVEHDEWVLIRHLPLTARWRIEDGPAQVKAAWQQSLAQSLRQALEHGGPNVVRYRSRREAVADLVYHAALGDNTRAWAWRQMGLVGDAAPSLSALLDSALRALLAEPTEIWPLLMRLLQADAATGAWTGLMRVLPAEAWQQLLLTAPQTQSFAISAASMSGAADTIMPVLDTAGAATLLAWVHSQPLLARRHIKVLAILLAAMSRPLGRAVPPSRPATLAEVIAAARQPIVELLSERASVLRREVPVVPDIAVGMSSGEDQPPVLAVEPDWQVRRASSDTATDALPPLPPLPEVARWQATEWAGLLFLLRLLPASGALDALSNPAEVPVFLWRLATRLQIPVTDPAVWGFCGDWQPSAVERNAAPEHWAALDALADRVATEWSAWLTTHAPDIPEPRLETVCRRPGRIRFEAGWIELHLPLDAADVRLRRIALDLDPGWLPWLGCVVRICYD